MYNENKAMPYKLIKFEKEENATGSLFVALVQKEGEEQPFRVNIEHFKTAEEAREEVDRWIATQDEDDARWLAEQEQTKAEEAGNATMEQLNNQLKT